jgi:hypothetical protein
MAAAATSVASSAAAIPAVLLGSSKLPCQRILHGELGLKRCRASHCTCGVAPLPVSGLQFRGLQTPTPRQRLNHTVQSPKIDYDASVPNITYIHSFRAAGAGLWQVSGGWGDIDPREPSSMNSRPCCRLYGCLSCLPQSD